MNNILSAFRLVKNYQSGAEKVCAVDNVTLDLNEGDYLAVVGPSGSGKSTLLHLLGGLDTPSHGQVFFDGKDIYHLSDAKRAAWRNRHIGFVFQFYHLIEELNVLENICVAAFSLKGHAASGKSRELLQYLGIERRAKFFPSQLSGGEKQKVAIARALINNPQILLCDEPTGNLDIDSQNKVVELLESLNREQKKTVIIVTHNAQLAASAQKTLKMESGAIR